CTRDAWREAAVAPLVPFAAIDPRDRGARTLARLLPAACGPGRPRLRYFPVEVDGRHPVHGGIRGAQPARQERAPRAHFDGPARRSPPPAGLARAVGGRVRIMTLVGNVPPTDPISAASPADQDLARPSHPTALRRVASRRPIGLALPDQVRVLDVATDPR